MEKIIAPHVPFVCNIGLLIHPLKLQPKEPTQPSAEAEGNVTQNSIRKYGGLALFVDNKLSHTEALALFMSPGVTVLHPILKYLTAPGTGSERTDSEAKHKSLN